MVREDDFNFSKFFIDCSIRFTFGHEFRHICQFNSGKPNRSSFRLQENLITKEYKQSDHVWEFDADRQGSYDVIKFVFRSHVGLKKKTDEKMRFLLFLGCASMVITSCLFYFNVMNQLEPKYIKKHEFYTKKNSHPHYLVRCVNIVSYYQNIINDEFCNLKVENGEFLSNVFQIVDAYFKKALPSFAIFDNFEEDLFQHMEEIVGYNSKLYDCAIKDSSIRELLISSNTKFEGYGI